LKRLAELTEGFSGADIEAVCREAGMQAIREAMRKNLKEIKVKMDYLEKAIKTMKERKEGSKESITQRAAT